jgi:hypothetical protein
MARFIATPKAGRAERGSGRNNLIFSDRSGDVLCFNVG